MGSVLSPWPWANSQRYHRHPALPGIHWSRGDFPWVPKHCSMLKAACSRKDITLFQRSPRLTVPKIWLPVWSHRILHAAACDVKTMRTATVLKPYCNLTGSQIKDNQNMPCHQEIITANMLDNVTTHDDVKQVSPGLSQALLCLTWPVSGIFTEISACYWWSRLMFRPQDSARGRRQTWQPKELDRCSRCQEWLETSYMSAAIIHESSHLRRMTHCREVLSHMFVHLSVAWAKQIRQCVWSCLYVPCQAFSCVWWSE